MNRTHPAHPRSHPWLAAGCTLSLLLWVSVSTLATATSPRVAEPAIARLVDGLTDIDGLLLSQESAVRDAAAKAPPGTTTEVPGFPVRGVGLTREEISGGTPDTWRDPLLRRAAAVLYREGLDAFSGEPGTPRFETGGGAWALSLLAASLHERFAFLRWPLGLGTLALAAGVLATLGPVRRWSVLGRVMAGGAVLPLLLAAAALAVTRLAGGAPGTLSGEAAGVAAVLARGPLIQAGTVVLGGLALWWVARRPVDEDDPTARLAAARAERDARRRGTGGVPPEPRRPLR